MISSPYRVRLRPKLSNHLFRSNQLTPTWWCCSVSPPCVLTNPLFAPRGGAPDVSAPLAGHPFQGPLDHSARKFRVSSRLVSVSLSALSSCSNSRTRACVVPSSCYSSRTRAPGLVEYPVHPRTRSLSDPDAAPAFSLYSLSTGRTLCANRTPRTVSDSPSPHSFVVVGRTSDRRATLCTKQLNLLRELVDPFHS